MRTTVSNPIFAGAMAFGVVVGLCGVAPSFAQSGGLDLDDYLGEDGASEETTEAAPQEQDGHLSEERPSEIRDDRGASEQNVAAGIRCDDAQSPCIVEQTGQFLRVLPRSFSAVYAEPGTSSDIRSNEVRPFYPVFVFDRQGLDFSDPVAPQGWYQVGYSQSRPFGWMRAQDVVEWRQALLLAYTHPGAGSNRRTPVLMFETMQDVQGLTTSPDRSDRVDEIFADLSAGNRPEGVVARESDNFLDIDEDFYLLPVIQWEREEQFEEPSHYLQVFAAVPGERGVAGEGTLADPTVLASGGDAGTSAPTGPLNVDVKFVMDMTGSMGPYIEAVRDGVRTAVQSLSQVGGANTQLRFGLVGYRDNPEVTPQLEWASHDFTPDLVSAQDFLSVLDNDGNPFEAGVSSDEWAEDVFAGVNTALDGNWSSQNSLRLIVLIGDASAHEPGTTARGSKSTTGLSAEALSDLAGINNTYIYSVYLQDEVAERDWDIASRQFSTLARLEDGQVGFYQTSAYDTASLSATFQAFANDIAGVILPAVEEQGSEILREFAGGERLPEGRDLGLPEDAVTAEAGIEVARGVLRAALVDYLGDGTARQKDFLSWVHDYDLADPSRPALRVHVLVTREQLDSILRRTEAIQMASETAIGARVDFFEQLQLLAAETSLGVDVDAGATFADQDFLPSWIEALPYRSRVLGMSPDMFGNLSPNEQIQFERQLSAKANAMREILGNVDAWIKLDENDPDLFDVTALPLGLLP